MLDDGNPMKKMLWPLSLLVALTFQHNIASADVIAPKTGTLVVMIPSKGGLVVAADSQHTVSGISCNKDAKIYFPKRPARTLVTVTGTADFLALKLPFGSDPCEEIARSPVLLSITSIVIGYLEEKNLTIADVQLADLAGRCGAAVKRLFDSFPSFAQTYIGKNIFHVVVAGYDAEKAASIIRSFTIDMSNSTTFTGKQVVDLRYGLSDPPDWRAFGAADFLYQHVLNGRGKQFVDSKFEGLLKRASVEEVDPNLAAEVATNIIDATSKTTDLISIKSGVGGPIHVFLIGPSGAEKLK